MIYWYLNEDGRTAWGSCEKRTIYPSKAKTYESFEEMVADNPELADHISDHSLEMKLGHLNNGPVQINQSVKGIEAMMFKAGAVTELDCPFCLEYARSENISFEEAVNLIWAKHQLAAKFEASRTYAKSKIRREHKLGLD